MIINETIKKNAMKTSNYTFKAPLHLMQTTLIIDTTKIYIFDNVKFYMSTCNQGIVSKELFDIHGDDVYVYGLGVNPIVKNKIKLA